MSEKLWNRCDYCGRFIAMKDFPKRAVRYMATPDSEFSYERWETYHKRCAV